MDLHYSQTPSTQMLEYFPFESPMDLHYSQTTGHYTNLVFCLNPLWIYTTLKLSFVRDNQ